MTYTYCPGVRYFINSACNGICSGIYQRNVIASIIGGGQVGFAIAIEVPYRDERRLASRAIADALDAHRRLRTEARGESADQRGSSWRHQLFFDVGGVGGDVAEEVGCGGTAYWLPRR